MRKFVLLLTAVFVTAVAAQAQIKPVAKDLGLGFRITGLSNVSFTEFSVRDFDVPEALVRFYLSDRIVLRAGLGVQSESITEDYTDLDIDTTGTLAQQISVAKVTEASQTRFSFTPGVEYHLASMATKIDPYVGLEVPIAFIGPSNLDISLDSVVTNLANFQTTYREDVSLSSKADGGLSIGANILAGFNYFFSDNFAIGAEYNLGFRSSTVGGKFTNTASGFIQPSSDPNFIIPVNSVVEYEETTSSTSIGLSSTGGVNISVFW
jgi:hypothetical protein